jgi:hypothetical protein
MGGADGGRDEWLKWLPLLEAWARAEGCDLLEIYGRPGWARLVRHDRRRIVLERRLLDGPEQPLATRENDT